MTKAHTRRFFVWGTIAFSAVFIALTVHTHTTLAERTNSASITPEVVHGLRVWGANNCEGCHTLMGEGAYYAPDLTKIVEQRGVPFPVLSDIDGAYALELGLCFYIGDDLMRVFKRMGHQMPVFQGNESWFLPIPATFVLDGEGRIADRVIDPDFRLNRMAVDRILTALARIAETAR